MARRQPTTFQATPWGWAIGGALTGLFMAVLLFAPARWVASTLQDFSNERLILLEPRGTLWNGSAQLLLSGGVGSRDASALPGRVNWQLRPAWDNLSIVLDASCCTPQSLQLQLRPRWAGVQLALTDGQSQWPGALLAGLGTPWNTVQAEGVLKLVTQSLSLTLTQGRLAIAGQAQLEALGMSSRLSTLKPMGSYRLTLLGGTSATFQLSTLEGSLQLSGDGLWLGSRLHFQGLASAEPAQVDALSNLLNIIGRRDGARSIIKVG
ncbi:MAG: type II secretion system protein N [Burkholderiaceae bacterium]